MSFYSYMKPVSQYTQLEELEAWKHLRDAWLNPNSNPFNELVRDSIYMRDGLCLTLESMLCKCIITEPIYYQMLNKIRQVSTRFNNHYKWPTTLIGAKMRVAFCNKIIAELEYEKAISCYY